MVIYIDMDDTLFDFSGSYQREIEKNPSMPYPQSQFGFFANLELLPCAFEAWKVINNVHDVYFLSAPSVRNPMCYTEKRISIEKNFGFEACSRLILSTNKSLLMGDILIDDFASGHYQDKFMGEVIQFGSSIYPSWHEILNIFKIRQII